MVLTQNGDRLPCGIQHLTRHLSRQANLRGRASLPAGAALAQRFPLCSQVHQPRQAQGEKHGKMEGLCRPADRQSEARGRCLPVGVRGELSGHRVPLERSERGAGVKAGIREHSCPNPNLPECSDKTGPTRKHQLRPQHLGDTSVGRPHPHLVLTQAFLSRLPHPHRWRPPQGRAPGSSHSVLGEPISTGWWLCPQVPPGCWLSPDGTGATTSGHGQSGLHS